MFARVKTTATLTCNMLTCMLFTDGSPRTVIVQVVLRVLTLQNNSFLSPLDYPLWRLEYILHSLRLSGLIDRRRGLLYTPRPLYIS